MVLQILSKGFLAAKPHRTNEVRTYHEPAFWGSTYYNHDNTRSSGDKETYGL